MAFCDVCGSSLAYGLVSVFRLHTKWGDIVCSTDCEARANEQA